MLIYTSSADGKKLEHVKRLGMGILVPSSTGKRPSANYKEVPTAMDNGAFSCWLKGYPFMPDVFLETMRHAYKAGLNMNFIVCPDIVAGGMKSLDFSLHWAEKLSGARLAFAVQDGMTINDVCRELPKNVFTHIFVGGTLEWKWETAEDWVGFAHANGMECHIGRAGRLQDLLTAHEIGADSVDSSSFARNDAWHIVEEYQQRIDPQLQMGLFQDAPRLA